MTLQTQATSTTIFFNMNLTKLFSIKEIEISYSYGTAKAERETIKSSLDAKNIFTSLIEKTIEHKESFMLLVLNNANEILGIKKVSDGGITATIVDVRLIFQTVLKANGVGFIVCHNHPSGKLQPSNADKEITTRIKNGAKILNLNFLDHLIISKENAFSFADEGIL